MATADDVPEITALGERFHAEAGWSDIAEFNRADCERTLAFMVDSPDAIVLVAESNGRIVGMAGGLSSPLYFNHAHKTGQEMFWWMEPGLRDGTGGRLLDALENEARAIGCESWAMIALDKVKPDLMARFYRGRGYRASEHTFIKRL